MRTQLLRVTGMTCDGCTNNVLRALTAVPGVADVEVSLPAGEATVLYDDRLTSPDRLTSAVTGAGYGVDATNAAPRLSSKTACCA